jgi:hypothetical protein
VLRIYVSLFVSNCSGERSFSALKRVKIELRSIMSHPRLNARSLLTVEKDFVREVNVGDIIEQFIASKSRTLFYQI